MPCGGKGAWWKAVKDPKTRDKARRYYYAKRGEDFAGMKAAAEEARRIYRAGKSKSTSSRRLKAVSLRAKRSQKRAPF